MLLQMTVGENNYPISLESRSASCKIESNTASYSERGQHSNNILVSLTQCVYNNHRARPIFGFCLYYFEVSINAVTNPNDLVVGLIDSKFPQNTHPGRSKQSYGFSCEGRLCHDSQFTDALNSKASKGSRLGVCLNFASQEVYFTFNGRLLSAVFQEVDLVDMHAAVGMKGHLDSVTFETSFLFDIEGLAKECALRQTQEILNEPFRDLNEIIQAYLMVNGYERSMELFANEAYLEEKPHFSFENEEIPDELTEPLKQDARVFKNYLHAPQADVPIDIDDSGCSDSLSLSKRGRVRELIVAGGALDAIEFIDKQCPEFFETFPEAIKTLKVQGFLETLNTDLVKALEYARCELAEFRDGKVCVRKGEDVMVDIDQVLGLLCYPQPSTSPLGYLMGNSQRQLTADVLNDCFLEYEGNSRDTVLEGCLKRMMALQELYYKDTLDCPITSIKLS